MKSKVIFKIANEKEIMKFILDLSKEEIKNKKFLRLPLKKEIKNKILSKSLNKKDKEKLEEDIKEFVSKDAEKMIFLLAKIEKHWNNNISNTFFKEMENIMKEKINKKFICYITNIFPGTYFDNYLVTLPYYEHYGGKKEREMESFILAEEILHLIYYDLWKKIFNKKWNLKKIIDELWHINNRKIWKIGEIIPEYLLVQNPKFKIYGWDKIDRVKAYPWIKKFRKISDPLWENKKNFRDFIIRIHEVLGIKL